MVKKKIDEEAEKAEAVTPETRKILDMLRLPSQSSSGQSPEMFKFPKEPSVVPKEPAGQVEFGKLFGDWLSKNPPPAGINLPGFSKEEKKPEPPKEPEMLNPPEAPKEPPKEPMVPDWSGMTPEEADMSRKEYSKQADTQRQTLERIFKDRISLGPPKEPKKPEQIIETKPQELVIPKEPVIPKEKRLTDLWMDIQRRKGTPVEETKEPAGVTFVNKGVRRNVYKVNEPSVSEPKTIETKRAELKESIIRGDFAKPPEFAGKKEIPIEEKIEERVAPKEIIPGISIERKGPEKKEPDSKSMPLTVVNGQSYNIQLTSKEVKSTTPAPIESQPVERKVERSMGLATEALTKKDFILKEKEDIKLKKEEEKFGAWEEKESAKTAGKVAKWNVIEKRGAPFYLGKQERHVGMQTFEKFQERTETEMGTTPREERSIYESMRYSGPEKVLAHRAEVIGPRLTRIKESWLGKPAVRETREIIKVPARPELGKPAVVEREEVTVEPRKPGILEKFAAKNLTAIKLRHMPSIPSLKREKDPRITEQWKRQRYFS